MSHSSDTPHSAHVESRSRKALRSYIIQASTLLEIVLSGLVLIGLLLSFIPLLKWMPGLLFDGNDVEIRGFLERALDIVIGVEFIKMLAKHSPGSSLEVLHASCLILVICQVQIIRLRQRHRQVLRRLRPDFLFYERAAS